MTSAKHMPARRRFYPIRRLVRRTRPVFPSTVLGPRRRTPHAAPAAKSQSVPRCGRTLHRLRESSNGCCEPSPWDARLPPGGEGAIVSGCSRSSEAPTACTDSTRSRRRWSRTRTRLHSGSAATTRSSRSRCCGAGSRPKILSNAKDAAELADLGTAVRSDRAVGPVHGEPPGAELPSVFRSIQLAPVWRAERPQKGRYRQFVQCDIDILGEPGIQRRSRIAGRDAGHRGCAGLVGRVHPRERPQAAARNAGRVRLHSR